MLQDSRVNQEQARYADNIVNQQSTEYSYFTKECQLTRDSSIPSHLRTLD